MKIDVSKLSYTKPVSFKEEVVFDPERFKLVFPLKEIKNTKVSIKATRYDDFINVHLDLTAKVVLVSSYSLKEFETTIEGDDELNFVGSLKEYEEEEDFILYKGNMIDLDEYIYNLLSASVPLKPIIEGEKAPTSGDNYSVTTDEEVAEKKARQGNDKFSKLDEIDFE